MNDVYKLETAPVVLHQWQNEDYAEFASMNAAPNVMRYFLSLLSRKESEPLTKKLDNLIAEKCWVFGVAERKTDNTFIGLNQADYLPVASCIEIGWRMVKAYWDKRYATEAEIATLYFAFPTLEQDQVATFTTVENSRARKVVSKLGMENRNKIFPTLGFQ
jgi:RimJ/RimL family protein N-acetyltransferase